MGLPDLLVPSVVAMLFATAMFAAAYLSIGWIRDVVENRRHRLVRRVEQHLAVILFGADVDAARAAYELAPLPRGILLDVLQSLASKLEGDADLRLRTLASTAGLTRLIRRRLHSRSWRRRSQGASLASLLPDGDPLRLKLLDDPHPVVRARSAESLESFDAVESVDRLIELLDDDVEAVRFAAQQALLLADSRVVPALARYLQTADGPGVVWALEIAANLPDVRLAGPVEKHLDSLDPRRRTMAIEAMVPWLHDSAHLVRLFGDPDPSVRAAAARAAGTASAEVLAAHVGRLLSDQSWEVRLTAGQALAMMGPTGLMTLRIHRTDPDAFAAEMAVFMLDSVDARARTLSTRREPTVAEAGAA